MLTSFTYYFRLVALLVLLPLCTAMYGGWMHSRSDGFKAELQQLDVQIAKLQSMMATKNRPLILRSEDGKTIAGTTLLRRMQNDRNLVHTVQSGSHYIVWLPITLGLTSCFIGLGGLLSIRRAGQRALCSRDMLLHTFRHGLQRLPWLIGAFGLCLAFSLAAILLYEASSYAVLHMGNSGFAFKMVAILFAGVGALLFFGMRLVLNVVNSARAVCQHTPLLLRARHLTEADAPKVWEFVGSVAKKTKTILPDNIVLGVNDSFFVTQAIVHLENGEMVEGRTLYLPLPYLRYLNREEAATILGHELGHFTGADTAYSLLFSPIYARAVSNLQAIMHAASGYASNFLGYVAAPVNLFGEYYLVAFHQAVNHWSRERELAADQLGVIAAGREASALALLRTAALEPVVHYALQDCQAEGNGGDEAAVVDKLRHLVKEYGLADPMPHLEDSLPHPLDSHPTTRQRLDAFGIAITPELLLKACDPSESSLLQELGLVTEHLLAKAC